MVNDEPIGVPKLEGAEATVGVGKAYDPMLSDRQLKLGLEACGSAAERLETDQGCKQPGLFDTPRSRSGGLVERFSVECEMAVL